MKGIILSAGQGRRLLPLTTDLPKCLLRIGGLTVLEWQLRMLQTAGVHRVVVVTGFGAAAIDRELPEITPVGMHVTTLYNDLYDRADNLVSCAVASPEMTGDFLLVNGDTLADPAILTCLLTSPKTPVAMAVARKDEYDADDMKVCRVGGLVTRVGKDLAAHETHGEAIGFSLYRGRGPSLFSEALADILREPEGKRRWYLSAVNLLAARGLVQGVAIEKAGGWAEIDYLHDLPRAQALVASLAERPAAMWIGADVGTPHGEEAVLQALPASGAR